MAKFKKIAKVFIKKLCRGKDHHGRTQRTFDKHALNEHVVPLADHAGVFSSQGHQETYNGPGRHFRTAHGFHNLLQCRQHRMRTLDDLSCL
jgi:hypothetical protein